MASLLPANPFRGRHRLQVAASFASAAIMLSVGIAGVLSLERVSDSVAWVEQAQSGESPPAHDAELAARRAALNRHLLLSEWVIAVGTGFAVLFAMATALLLRRTFIERAKTASELSLRARELELALEHGARTLEELRSGRRERELLIKQLERSNRDLDQFAYITSHDLKAPLRGVANLASWIQEDLADRELPTETRHHLALLQDRVHRMESLIEAILQYSRAGRDRAEPESVDCGALLRETLDLLSPSDQTDLRIAPDLPTIFTYRWVLQQALINLMSNALKFAPADHPQIDVAWRDDGGFIELMVSDNGAGIDAEHHSKIFKVFQTLGRDEAQEGTGIGLAVVRKTADAVGGSVRVVSALGEGATFILRWPKVAQQPQELSRAR